MNCCASTNSTIDGTFVAESRLSFILVIAVSVRSILLFDGDIGKQYLDSRSDMIVYPGRVPAPSPQIPGNLQYLRECIDLRADLHITGRGNKRDLFLGHANSRLRQLCEIEQGLQKKAE